MTVAMHTIQVPLVKAYNIGLQKKRMLTKRTCASKPKRNKKHHYMYINVQKWKKYQHTVQCTHCHVHCRNAHSTQMLNYNSPDLSSFYMLLIIVLSQPT